MSKKSKLAVYIIAASSSPEMWEKTKKPVLDYMLTLGPDAYDWVLFKTWAGGHEKCRDFVSTLYQFEATEILELVIDTLVTQLSALLASESPLRLWVEALEVFRERGVSA